MLAAVQGTYETKMMGSDTVRTGILLATPNRLVFYAKKLGGYDLESFGYDKVSSFEQSKSRWATPSRSSRQGTRCT